MNLTKMRRPYDSDDALRLYCSTWNCGRWWAFYTLYYRNQYWTISYILRCLENGHSFNLWEYPR